MDLARIRIAYTAVKIELAWIEIAHVTVEIDTHEMSFCKEMSNLINMY